MTPSSQCGPAASAADPDGQIEDAVRRVTRDPLAVVCCPSIAQAEEDISSMGGAVRLRWRVVLGLVGVLAVIGALAVSFVAIPPYLVPSGSFANAVDAARAQNDVRGLVVQAFGGLVLAVGGYVTWRQFRVSRDALQHNLQASAVQLEAVHTQLAITREGQVTQRFSHAIEQLGSEQLVVRLGAIYTLERIARDSAVDRAGVADLLCAYIRQHSPRAQDLAAASACSPPPHLQLRAADVQAALTVLGRSDLHLHDVEPLRLLHTDLRRADLRAAHLVGADLEGSDLGWAWIPGARLDRADLTEANLTHAHLAGSTLDGADLTNAVLRGADLRGASLRGADLRGADLTDTATDETTVWSS
jgi:hypothetical protein